MKKKENPRRKKQFQLQKNGKQKQIKNKIKIKNITD
jgi:hypothetical protein